jgi:hypothetical protein
MSEMLVQAQSLHPPLLSSAAAVFNLANQKESIPVLTKRPTERPMEQPFAYNPAQTLEEWAELGRELPWARLTPPLDWGAVTEIIAAARPTMEYHAERLRDLIKKSNRILSPLADPLCIDFGVHRFLASRNEMAYSDWLAWIVEKLRDPKLVFQLFDIDNGMAIRACTSVDPEVVNLGPTVKREHSIPYDDDDHSGRLDLLICYPGKAAIIVEVKVGGAEQADKNKQIKYWRWLRKRLQERHKHAVLLVTEAEKKSYHHFDVVLWSDLCIRLREMARKMLRRRQTNGSGSSKVEAAMILAFVGAGEQNLLEMSSDLVEMTVKRRNSNMTAYIPDYLAKFTEGGSDAKTLGRDEQVA